jgi:NTE family protein
VLDTIDVLLQTFAIMGNTIADAELREADVVMRPSLVGVGSADFAARKQSIRAGREAALAQLAELKARIAAKTR